MGGLLWAGIGRLTGAEYHHGFAFNRYQALIFQGFKYAAHHLAGAADDAADFLAGNFNLHAVWVGHGIGLFAQVEQGARDAAGDIKRLGRPLCG